MAPRNWFTPEHATLMATTPGTAFRHAQIFQKMISIANPPRSFSTVSYVFFFRLSSNAAEQRLIKSSKPSCSAGSERPPTSPCPQLRRHLDHAARRRRRFDILVKAEE